MDLQLAMQVVKRLIFLWDHAFISAMLYSCKSLEIYQHLLVWWEQRPEVGSLKVQEATASQVKA